MPVVHMNIQAVAVAPMVAGRAMIGLLYVAVATMTNHPF